MKVSKVSRILKKELEKSGGKARIVRVPKESDGGVFAEIGCGDKCEALARKRRKLNDFFCSLVDGQAVFLDY